VKRRHPDDDPEIPDWDETDYRSRWELEGRLRERPESVSRQQGREETWD
jgi:hypothetical protein